MCLAPYPDLRPDPRPKKKALPVGFVFPRGVSDRRLRDYLCAGGNGLTELSAFYFDIRKDTLYCDAPSSLARKAALTTIDIICDAIRYREEL